MRLLHVAPDGSLTLTKDRNPPPPYAILSHTWAEDEEEVTFDEIEKKTGLNKAGYNKLEFCMNQAKVDGLQYCWVDTCCINKADASELEGAIRSMYRWYHNAARCYVYLSDVFCQGRDDTNSKIPTWDSAFRRSRWFKRGWTLQELLAPQSVLFFSQEGQNLGTKTSLEEQIHEITQIPVAALRGTPLSDFSAEDLLLWAADRETKKLEDKAYCLLGMFDIPMCLRYGEGEGALKRLKRKIIQQAETEKCHVKILQALRKSNYRGAMEDFPLPAPRTLEWFYEHEAFVKWSANPNGGWLWYTADPGIGKSVLCRQIVHTYQDMPNLLVLYFFFLETDPLHCTIECALQALIHQLLIVRRDLLKVVANYLDQHGRAVVREFSSLRDILGNCLAHLQGAKVLCVFDALEQCSNLDLSRFMDCMTSLLSICNNTGQIMRLFIACRPYQNYKSLIGTRIGLQGSYWIRAKDNVDHISSDIEMYIDQQLESVASCLELSDDEVTQVRINIGAKRHRVFLCVALAIQKLIERPPLNVESLLTAFNEIPDNLEEYYNRALKRCPNHQTARRIFAAIIFARRPLRIIEVALFNESQIFIGSWNALLETRLADRIRHICGLLVDVVGGRVHLIHNSLQKFLLRPRGVVGQTKSRPSKEGLQWKYVILERHAEIMMTRACISSSHSKRWTLFNPYAMEHQASHVHGVLRCAREHYQNTEITKLIGLGLDVKQLDVRGKSLLHHALDDRVPSINTNLILLLLHHGGLVQNADYDGMTCLHYAAFRNNPRLIRILLDAGFDVDAAVDRESINAAKYGASITQPSGRGLTPLHAAVHFCCQAATQALLDAGADPIARDAFGNSPLHLAVSRTLPGRHINDMWSDHMQMPEEIWGDPDDQPEVERVLEAARTMRQSVLDCLCGVLKRSDTLCDDDGRTALHRIPYGSNNLVTGMISYLLGRGHGRLAQDVQGVSPVHLAAKAGDVSSLEILVTQAADLVQKDAKGRNALHFAAQANHLPTVEFILRSSEYLAIENSVDHMGMNALHHALGSTHFAEIGVVRMLIAAGVDSTRKDSVGRDPLCVYLTGPLLTPGEPDVIQALIRAGGDVRYSSQSADNLAHLFVSSWTEFELDGFLQLERAGVDVRASNARNQTVLHRAALCGTINTTMLSHCLGCLHMDVELHDDSGKRPLDIINEGVIKKYPPNIWMPDRWKHSVAAFGQLKEGIGDICQCESMLQ